MSLTTRQSKRIARALYRWSMVGGKVDEQRARKVLYAIVNRRRRGYHQLLKEFRHLLKAYRARSSATIESAEPLSSDLKESVRSQLEKSFGVDLRAEFVEQPALLGGVRIQVGCDVYDGSIRSKLEQLQASFEMLISR